MLVNENEKFVYLAGLIQNVQLLLIIINVYLNGIDECDWLLYSEHYLTVFYIQNYNISLHIQGRKYPKEVLNTIRRY